MALGTAVGSSDGEGSGVVGSDVVGVAVGNEVGLGLGFVVGLGVGPAVVRTTDGSTAGAAVGAWDWVGAKLGPDVVMTQVLHTTAHTAKILASSQ